MPFYPMRPTSGRDLRTARSVSQLWDEIKDDTTWIAQPKLNGDRACLAVVERRVFVQNRHGNWYRYKVQNAKDFLKLPDGTCFDGEVFNRNFYPFELLVTAYRSLLLTTAQERVTLAKLMVENLKHPWMFEQPNKNWLMRRSANRPHYEGVVLKKTTTPYIVLGSSTQSSLSWFKRLWPN